MKAFKHLCYNKLWQLLTVRLLLGIRLLLVGLSLIVLGLLGHCTGLDNVISDQVIVIIVLIIVLILICGGER